MDARVETAKIDLSDNATFAKGFPHDHFTWARAHAPIYWHEPTAVSPDGEGFWVMSRHDDAMAVMLDPVTFSSDKGGGRTGGRRVRPAALARRVAGQPASGRGRAGHRRGGPDDRRVARARGGRSRHQLVPGVVGGIQRPAGPGLRAGQGGAAHVAMRGVARG